MGPKKKATDIDETPPDTPTTTYDVLVYVCLKDAEPFQWLPADHIFADERTVDQIVGFDPKRKMSLQQRAKINNYLLDETQGSKAMSIFCRVEKGTDPGRVKKLLLDLNSRLKSLPYPQKSSLKAMLIKNFGEKLMKDWSYDERDPITNKIIYRRWKEVSTRSQGVSKLPVTTGDEEGSDNDFQTGPAKKGLASSSEGSSLPAAQPSTSGSFLSNPFFTPQPGTSRTLGLGKKSAAVPSTSKQDPASGKGKVAPSKEKPPSQSTDKKQSGKKTPSKRFVSESSTDSESDTIKSKMSPAKKIALEQVLAPLNTLPGTSSETSYQVSGASTAQPGQIFTFDPHGPLPDVPTTYTEAIVISEEQLDIKLRSFLTDLKVNRARSEPFKAAVKSAVEEAVEPKFAELRDVIRDLIANEIQKVMEVLATKATKCSTTKILESINATRETIEDFSIEQARIRCEISNITEHAAEKTSRSCGILGRFLPFDYMGMAFDVFMSSHYVQSKVVALIKDEFESRKGSINVRIAFSFTNVFLTRLAMAHLVWRHPKNPRKILYYKRKVPDAFEKIIKTDIIPFVRTLLQLGGENFVGSFEGVRKVMATRFANGRTKMLEVAFAESANQDAAIDALHNVDNEFYVHNVHAIPNTVEMDDKEEYRAKLRKDRAECGTGEDREAAGKPFKSEQTVFDSLRHGNASKKVFSVYEVMQGIIAAAKADGKDVTKLTFDQSPNLPDLKGVYKQVLNDHIADLEGLLSKFPVVTTTPTRRTRSDSEAEEEEQLKNMSLGSVNESEPGEEDDLSQEPPRHEDAEDDQVESPSEFEQNVETVVLSSDEDTRCHTQQPEPATVSQPVDAPQTQSKPAPVDPPTSAPASAPLPLSTTFVGQSSFRTPIVITGVTTRSFKSVASSKQPDRPSYAGSAYDEHGKPQPLPPMPDNPYELPDPFANMSAEELEARLRAAHLKAVQKRKEMEDKEKK